MKLRVYYKKLVYYLSWTKLALQIAWLLMVTLVKVIHQLFKFLFKYFFLGSIDIEAPEMRSKPNKNTELYELLNVPASANEGEIRKVSNQF